jgi:hypothetical protein
MATDSGPVGLIDAKLLMSLSEILVKVPNWGDRYLAAVPGLHFLAIHQKS